VKIPHISEVKIKDLGSLPLSAGAVVIVVGPNDGGKSTFLRDIAQSTRPGPGLKWLDGISWDLGAEGDFKAFVADQFDVDADSRFVVHRMSGQRTARHEVDNFYREYKTSHPDFLIKLLDASSRIGLADPTESPDVTSKKSSHPYHRFFYDAGAETAFSDKIESAFGASLRVNRTGKTTSAFMGTPPSGERLSEQYELGILTDMERVQDAGDGVRSYTGILLNASAAGRPVTLIDEPEAFLHPPQARKLGKELAEEAKRTERQTFIATHSSEIIQGALSSDNRNVHLLYLNRKGEPTAHYISGEIVKEFSSNPFLAQTNALDALFYKRTIICEAPADITFFKWALGRAGYADLAFDSFWLPSYGKSAIPGMASDIKKLGVEVACVFDIDVLLSPETIEAVTNVYELNPSRFTPALKNLAESIRVPPAAETLQKISDLVDELAEDDEDDESTNNVIRQIKRLTSALGKSWYLKTSGLSAIPKGQLRAAIDGLLSELGNAQILILREGEIENYAPQVGGHGPAWVREVIERNGVSESEMARLIGNFKPLVSS
jgi:ABC-type taurine transport system ATPase subunit